MTEPILLGDRYRLERVIGRGGMAEVWRATDIRLHRDVAIKRLRIDLATDPTFQARFRREAQAAAGLNHPNIVAVYDTGEEIDPPSGVKVPYIVMELVDGHTLKEVLRDDRRILPERALEFTQGVLDALSYSHKSGIVHRDIKPANVMITPAGTVKVMDFGIARAVADTSATMTQTAAVIGTAQYLSPEQARGETVDARSDVYSAGVLLYELLAGRPPFVGDSPVSVAYQHVRETPTPPSHLDPEITPQMDAVVLKALAKDPADRYQTAREMREDIARLLAGEKVLAAPPVVAVDTEPTAPTQAITASDPKKAVPVVPVAPVAEPEPEAATTGLQPAVQRRRTSTGTIVLSALLLALLGAIVFAIYMFTRDPAPTATQVAVPGLRGYTQTAAETRLADQGLKAKVTQTHGAADTKGQVTAQNPAQGTMVDKGSTVTITVNLGPTTKAIPTGLVGKNVDAAKKILADAGFKNVKTTDATAGTEPASAKAGDVLSVDPAEGTTDVDPATTTVTLSVATGKSPVPNFGQMQLAQAQDYATQQGFTLTPVYKTSTAALPGYVFSQDPTAGTSWLRTDPITVFVAKAAATSSASASGTQSAPPSSAPASSTQSQTATSSSTQSSAPSGSGSSTP